MHRQHSVVRTSSGRGTLYGGIPETVLSLVEKGFSPIVLTNGALMLTMFRPSVRLVRGQSW